MLMLVNCEDSEYTVCDMILELATGVCFLTQVFEVSLNLLRVKSRTKCVRSKANTNVLK